MSVVLIGMPGSGKSELGRAAAKRLGGAATGGSGYAFGDLDDEIVNASGMSIPEIFEQEGEAGFRKRETAALTLLAASSSPIPRVISAGGGIVTMPENLPLLRKIGTIIHVKRDLKAIWASVGLAPNRPLLSDEEKLSALWEARRSLYEEWAEVVFVNEGTFSAAAARLSALIEECA